MGSIYRPKYRDRHGNDRESAVWWIKFYAHGRAIRESTETADYDEARDLLKKKEGEAVSGRAPAVGRKITLEELLQDVVTDYQINGYRSLVDLNRRIDLHIMPFFGNRKAAGICTADLRRYIAQRQQAGAANAEVNREMTGMKRAYHLGMQSGKIATAPHFPMLKEAAPRSGFFEREQVEAVIRQLSSSPRARHLAPVVRFAYITGWRKSEILGLEWRQVDFEAGTVRLEPGTTKNDEARVFPFTQELRAILEGQRASIEELKRKRGKICPWVFHRHGRRLKDIKRSFDTAREAAGVPGRIFHDFRRTAVRNLVRAGIPEGVAMKMTGHKTRSVFERYNIVSEADLFEAARRLEAFSGQSTGKDTGKDRPTGRKALKLHIAK